MKTASIMQPLVNERFQGWSPVVNWCDQCCEGEWYYIGKGVFEFDLDSDYTMFVLRWA